MVRWKAAFFAVLGGWVLSSAYLGFKIFDRDHAASDFRTSYADCEAHRDFLHHLAKGRMTRAEVQANRSPIVWSANGYEREITPESFRFGFDAEGRYVASEFGASAAGDVPEDAQ